jgi:hypothetical protein
MAESSSAIQVMTISQAMAEQQTEVTLGFEQSSKS